MLGTSGYLLWSGIAAVLVGIVEWLAPFSWTAQGSLFALLTLVCVYLWYRWMRHRERHQQPNSLNQRGNQLIGTLLTLDAPLVNGIGHVRLGDSSWRVQADRDLPAGAQVVVTGVEGITLHIRPR